MQHAQVCNLAAQQDGHCSQHVSTADPNTPLRPNFHTLSVSMDSTGFEQADCIHNVLTDCIYACRQTCTMRQQRLIYRF